MKLLKLGAVVAFLLFASLAIGQSLEIPSSRAVCGIPLEPGCRAIYRDGQVVEIAIDFSLLDIHLGPQGEVEMEFTAQIEKQEMGFAVSLGVPTDRVVDVGDQTVTMPSATTELVVSPVGGQTASFEEFLNRVFFASNSHRNRFAGVYRGLFDIPTPTLDFPVVCRARSLGLAIGTDGGRTDEPLENFFRLDLFFDAPCGRLTLYVSEPGGYGGRSPAEVTRREWFSSVPRSER